MENCIVLGRKQYFLSYLYLLFIYFCLVFVLNILLILFSNAIAGFWICFKL